MSEDDSQDDSQKTEDPTPKRIQEMRDKGQVAMSREINSWLMLFTGTLIIVFLGPWLFGGIAGVMTAFIEKPHLLLADSMGFHQVMMQAFKEIGAYLTLPAILLVIAAIIGPFAQIGPIFSAETIVPKFEKISIIKGLGRLFAMRSIVEFLKGLVKLVIVGVVIGIILYPVLKETPSYVGQSMGFMLDKMMDLTIQVMIGVLAVLFVVAVLDLIYQRHEHMKKAKMSIKDIKDEFKQSEGDPHVKGRLRMLRQERARKRMMADVPKADVIITNPTHYAIALKYNPQKMNAPMMIAKGVDAVALRIRAVATEHKIPIMENKPLARALHASMEIDQEIPAEHFKAVAAIISYVFKQKGKSLT